MKKLTFILGVLMMSITANAKSLVVYYSKTGEQYGVGTITEGNTAKVAKEIAAQTGADILELKTVKKYPEGYKANIFDKLYNFRGKNNGISKRLCF